MQLFFKAKQSPPSHLVVDNNVSCFRAGNKSMALRLFDEIGDSLMEVVIELMELNNEEHSALISFHQRTDAPNSKRVLVVSIIRNSSMEEDEIIIPENGVGIYEGHDVKRALLEITTMLDQLTGKVAVVSNVVQ